MLIVKNQSGAIIQVYGVEPITECGNDDDDEDIYLIMGIVDPIKPIRTLLGEYSSKELRDAVMNAIEDLLEPFIMPKEKELDEYVEELKNNQKSCDNCTSGINAFLPIHNCKGCIDGSNYDRLKAEDSNDWRDV